MDWKQILVSALVTLILSGILVPICTKLVGHNMTKYFDKKDEKEREAKKKKEEDEAIAKENAEKLAKIDKQQQEEKLFERMDAIVKKHTDPIDEELQKVEEDLHKVKNGTVDTLRDRILSSYYKCAKKGFYTQYEFENIHHMYDDYVELHGNSFVEKCIKDFDSLDSEEKFMAKQKAKKAPRKTRQIKEG